jgi:hypothetical protein
MRRDRERLQNKGQGFLWKALLFDAGRTTLVDFLQRFCFFPLAPHGAMEGQKQGLPLLFAPPPCRLTGSASDPFALRP